MRYLYTVVIQLLIPFVLIRLLLVSYKYPVYRKRWLERLGIINWKNTKPLIWIHAVSVGEVNASKPIINQFLKKYNNHKILLTTVTPTGSITVKEAYKENILNLYLPYDIPFCIDKFLQSVKPSILITMETEIWPNLYHLCNKANIPILIVNGRLSQKSTRRYKLASKLTATTLQLVGAIAAQTRADAERFITLGANEKNISITGNLKFDIQVPQSIMEKAEPLRHYFSINRSIWIAASTHEGEEKIILEAHRKILNKHPNAILILAPRHPERVARIIPLCKKANFKYIKRTEEKPFTDENNIFLLDTLGELNLFYAASQVAFVGGSLVRNGGQNMLEPASLNLPVITGPNTHNFSEISELLLQKGALLIAQNEKELSDKVIDLLSDANLRNNMGERGEAVIEANRGSSIKTFELIEKYLNN
ncbi:MAG: lipid IV(A) 3-deoxy-D-manno-octulosonic acid transferase [Gammaproteobacteria bacterium]